MVDCLTEKAFYSEPQLMAARAITLIKRKLTPKCEECGYGADRPNCAMDKGGYCNRHEQEDMRAYREVIDELERVSGLRKVSGWETDIPLKHLIDLSKTEMALMQDLLDLHREGKKHITRSQDERWTSLSRKHVVGIMATSNRWEYGFNKRGLELAEELFPCQAQSQG